MYNKHITKKNLLLIGLVFAILASAMLIAAVFFKNQAPSPSTPALSSEEESSLPASQITYTGWLEFFSPNLGLYLMYPPQFKNYQSGTLTSKVNTNSKTGAFICIDTTNCLLSQESVFGIRSTSLDWTVRDYVPSFLDLQGYRREGDDFYVFLPSGDQVFLPGSMASEYTTDNGVQAILVKGMDGEQSDVSYPHAGWIGALINTGYIDYPGIAVKMQLKHDLTEDTFKAILSSFKFPWKDNYPDDEQMRKEASPPRFSDPDIKDDLKDIAKILNCRYIISGFYPPAYLPDQACGKTGVILNGVTQKPYYYKPTDSGRGFVIRAKLSSGEIYQVTNVTYPPPTPTPDPRAR